MQPLFTAELPDKDGFVSPWEVFFENDVYTFRPMHSNGSEVHLRREEDRWKDVAGEDAEGVQTFTKALDNYLLSQH